MNQLSNIDTPIPGLSSIDLESPPPMAPNETRTNLIINHIPKDLREEGFQKIFSTVGEIKSFRIMKDLKTGYSHGYGFVDYEKPESAARAILQLNNYALSNKHLKVAYAHLPGQDPRERENNLYIQNLPKTYDEQKLGELFAPFGSITQKLIYREKSTGEPRGVAFVKYATSKEAYAAIQGMNGRLPEGGSLPLIVKISSEQNSNNYPGRGRGKYVNRGGYSNMAGFEHEHYGGMEPHDYHDYDDYGAHPGKMPLGRMSNRYNPIGSGGGYGADPHYYPPSQHPTRTPFSSFRYGRM